MLSSSKLLAVALLAAVAATGFVSGHMTAAGDGRGCERGARERGGFPGMLQDSLSLTDAQRDSVRAIVIRHRPEMRALMDRIRPQMDSLRLVINNEIATKLTPAQQQKFAQMRDRWRTDRARHDSTAAARSSEGRR